MTDQEDRQEQETPDPANEVWLHPTRREPQGYLYTPSQVGFLTFLFGPLCGVWLLKSNFDVLGKPEYSKRTLINGIGASLFLFVGSLLLPQKFPTYVVPVIFSFFASFVARRFQLTREAILESEQFAIESSWKGLKIGLLAMLLSFALFVFITVVFKFLGLISLPEK